jgi:hypothetical protein
MASPKKLLQSVAQAAKDLIGVVDSAKNIRENDYGWGYDGVSVSMLLGSGHNQARSRIQIVEKYHLMMGDFDRFAHACDASLGRARNQRRHNFY